MDRGDGHECQALGATSLEGGRRGGSVFAIALGAVLASGRVIWPPQQRRLGVRVPREFTTWNNHDSAAAKRLPNVAAAPVPTPGTRERLLKRAVAVTQAKVRRHPPPPPPPPPISFRVSVTTASPCEPVFAFVVLYRFFLYDDPLLVWSWALPSLCVGTYTFLKYRIAACSRCYWSQTPLLLVAIMCVCHAKSCKPSLGCGQPSVSVHAAGKP